MKKNLFCRECGTAYEVLAWPRECRNRDCLDILYDNPLPVVIVLQGVRDTRNGRTGLAIAQRAIKPHIGGWTLVAGHVENNGESLEEAAGREFNEETSVLMGRNPRLLKSVANGKGHLLAIVEPDWITLDDFSHAKPCKENIALDVMWEFRELAFPIHTEAAREWFLR